MSKEVTDLVSKIIRPIYLQVTENRLKSLIALIVIFIIVPPLIRHGQIAFETFPYLEVGNGIIGFFLSTFSPSDIFLLFALILTLLWVASLHGQHIKTKTIVEKFDNLDSWNIPVHSQWTTDKCGDVKGKMLCVTNGDLPGTLKAAYEWYDYEFSFEAKMTKNSKKVTQMIGFVVRSENNNNGVFFQFSKNEFRPHLLLNGKYYLDSQKKEPMKIILKENTWIKFRVQIKGDNIDIYVNDYKLYYRIPNYTYNVDNTLLYENKLISELEESNKNIQDKIAIWLTIFDKLVKEPNADKKEEIRKELHAHEVPQNTQLVFEYPRGSIGFRESGQERTFFRQIKLKKI